MSELGRTQIAVQNHNGPRSLLHREEAACVQTMITLRTRTELSGITGIQVTDFLLNCTDEEYQRWWPGTHLSFHTIHRVPGEVGNVVVMDEFIGQRRVTVQGIVTEVEPGRRLVWQFRKLVRWPVRLSLELDENDDALQLTHTVEAGFHGLGRILDPLFRFYFSRRFADALDQHVRTEFPQLQEVLRDRAAQPNAAAGPKENTTS